MKKEVIYTAYDGDQFNSENKCKKHEEMLNRLHEHVVLLDDSKEPLWYEDYELDETEIKFVEIRDVLQEDEFKKLKEIIYFSDLDEIENKSSTYEYYGDVDRWGKNGVKPKITYCVSLTVMIGVCNYVDASNEYEAMDIAEREVDTEELIDKIKNGDFDVEASHAVEE